MNQTPTTYSEEIKGVTVYYTKFEGMVDNRYEMAFLINDEWKVHTLIATEKDRLYRIWYNWFRFGCWWSDEPDKWNKLAVSWNF